MVLMTVLTHHNPPGLQRSPAFTQAVEVAPSARLLFIGGQNGVDEDGEVVDGGIGPQTTQALRNVQTAVESTGGSIADIAKWTVLVTDATQIGDGFAAFSEFWDAGTAPPAITVQVIAGLAGPDLLVEIEAVAAIPA